MARYAYIYTSQRFRNVRLIVIQRDLGLCQHCLKNGIKRKGKQVHHIIWLDDFNILNDNVVYGLENLILLCDECHNKVHERSSGLENFIVPI